MAHQGGLSRDELEAKLAQSKIANALSQAQVSQGRQPVYAEPQKTKGVETAITEVSERGTVEIRFWVIVQLSNGKYAWHENTTRKSKMPSVADLMSEKAPLNIYNPSHIVSMELFRNIDEANKRWAELARVKKEEEQSTVSQVKSLLSVKK